MKWFLNMKIGTKLISSFLVIALLAGAIGVVGIININTINKADTLLYEENALGLDYSGNAATLFGILRYDAIEMLVLDDESKRIESINRLNGFFLEIDELLQKYEDGIINEEDRQIFSVLKPEWEKYKSYIQEYIKAEQAGQYEQAKSILLGEANKIADTLQESFSKLMQYNSKSAKLKSDANEQLASTASITMVVVAAVGVVIAIILGIFVSNIISRPVKELARSADKLAVGDIDVNINVTRKDEIGNLMEAFAKMVANIREQALAVEKIAGGDLTVNVSVKSDKDLMGKNLTEMIEKNNEVLRNISAASEQVASGSRQMSDSSMALSQGATEQASSIEELTASLEEVSSQTKLNAENASQANELAETAKANAELGNRQMQEMLKAMEEINDSSSSISKIIKVIDEIAFQTNILALNAAVEAARAGQHGKGFAVVAEEVRNLAARSANAAKETTDMIEGSIKKTEGGTRIANDTAKALNEIVGNVAKVANLVNDIAIASNEQASGVAQINQGIMQVSQVVQTNSATAEESAAASEELSGQAALLREMVSKFTLKKAASGSGRIDQIDPEVLRMLEGMAEKKKPAISPDAEAYAEAAPAKSKIALSDRDFGKY